LFFGFFFIVGEGGLGEGFARAGGWGWWGAKP